MTPEALGPYRIDRELGSGGMGKVYAATCEREAAGLEYEQRLHLRERMEARFLLWKASADPADLAEAHHLLQFLIDHAPEEYRESMVENVPLHREIVAAWNEHGG